MRKLSDTYGRPTIPLAIRVRGGLPYLPVAIEANGTTYADEAMLPVPPSEVAGVPDGEHRYDMPASLLAGLRGRLTLPGRKQVAYLEWPRGIRAAPNVWTRDWDESAHPRGPDGKFGAGGGGTATAEPNAAQRDAEATAQRAAAALAPAVKELEKTEEGRSVLARGAALAARVGDSIRNGVATGVKKALDAADDESRGGVSLIQGGWANRSPAAVAHGIAQLVSVVYENVHQELYETAMADHSIPGAHAVGKIGGKVAAAGEKALLTGVAWAFLKARGLVTGKDFAVWIDVAAALTHKAVGDNGTAGDLGGMPPAVRDALIAVAVSVTAEALEMLDEELGGALVIPGDDAIETRVRKLLDGGRL